MINPDTTKPIPVESWPAGLRELRSWVKAYGWLIDARQYWPLEDNPAATFIEFKARRPDGLVAVQASWSNDFGKRSTLRMSGMLVRWPAHAWLAVSLKSALGVIEDYGRARCEHCGLSLDAKPPTKAVPDPPADVWVHHKTQAMVCADGRIAARKAGS